MKLKEQINKQRAYAIKMMKDAKENDDSFSLDINYLGLFVAVSAFILKLKTKLSMFIILIIAIAIGMLYKFIGL